jgi:hypothetical protein
MAQIVLHPFELAKGHLPDLCVVCGADHTTPVTTKLHIIVAENLVTNTLRVQDAWFPCCQLHQWHFYRQRILVVVGALCMAMFLPCLGLTALILGPFVRDLPFGWVVGIVALIAPFVVGFIIMYIAKHGNVQAGDITDQGWLIVNVSDGFVAAVEAERRRDDRRGI